MKEIVDEIQSAIFALSKIEQLNTDLPNQQSEIDSKLTDILHLIENNKLNTKQCYRAVRLIHELRTERRNILNSYEIDKQYKTNEAKLQNEGNRQLLLADIKKNEKRLNNSKYTNRVYSKQELLDLIG